jgi:CheY-like chemotaxis protein
MKILVVEDEPKTGTYLKQGLLEAGFVADLVSNGLDGLHLALTEAYDLVILDVMLPGIDGWQILQGILEARGLKQMNDAGELERIIDEVVAANPDNVAQFRAGKDKAFNALVGQIMKASKGKANPQQVNDLLRQKIG